MKSYREELRVFQLDYLVRALRAHNGNVSRAAAEIGMHRNTVTRMLAVTGNSVHGLRKLPKSNPYRTAA